MSPDRNATAATEEASIIAEVGECCQGASPYCAAGCLVMVALQKRAMAGPAPGGAMPEPDAGMRVTDDGGCRWMVDRCEPAGPGSPGWIVTSGDWRMFWTPDHIREIRTPDGRVLWRAGDAGGGV